MNILQFWLIDSIVKASTSHDGDVLPGTAPSDPADHEPLMDGSESDDEDTGGNSLHHDIENPPQLDGRASATVTTRGLSLVETKVPSSKSSSTEWDEEDTHLYPPSLSSSPQNSVPSPMHTVGSQDSRSQSPRVKLKRVGRKRSPPPPLHIEPLSISLDRSGAQVIAIDATPQSGNKFSPTSLNARDPDKNEAMRISTRTLNV